MPNRTDPSKKLKIGDYVEVLVPLGKDDEGNTTYEKGIVSRVGLSDEKWADVKARAEASGRLSTIKDSDAAPALETQQVLRTLSEPEGDVIRFKDKSGGVVVVPRGDLDDAAWSKRIADAADKDSFESAVQDGEVVKASPRRAKFVGTEDLADEGAIPTEAKRIEGGESGGGTLGSKLRGMVGSLVGGALPGGVGGGTAPMSMPAPGPGSSDAGVSDAGVSDAGVLAPPSVTPSPIGVAGGAAPDAGVPAPSMGLSSPPKDSSSGPMPDMGYGAPQPLTNPVDLAVAKGMPAASGTPPMSGQDVPPQPAPVSMAPPGYKAEMGMKARGGPSSAPGGVPSLAQAEKDFMAGQKTAVETAQEGARQRLAERAKYEADLAAFDAAQVKARGRQREEEDRVNSAYLQTLEELSKKQEIDPNHFWDSKSTGQKVFMALGGFLAGIGGRDPSGRIDQMIAQDIAVQRENFNLAREGAKNKLAGLNTLYGRLRERGLDDREAAAAARAAMNEGLARRLEGISEQMAPGEAKAKADMAIAQFRMNKAKAEDDLKTGAAQRAHMKRMEDLQEFELGIKMSAAAAKANEETPMQATLSKEMAAIEDGIAQARQMLSDSSVGTWEKIKTAAAGGSYGKVWESIAKLADPNASARAMDFKGKRIGMLKDIFGGALQAHELAAAENMLPDTISPTTDLRPYFERIVAFGQQQIARRQERYARSGPDTRGPSAGGQGGAR